MGNRTNFVFTPGKLTVILDAQAGSSGKGVIGSYVTQHADNWTFACNTFMPQAGHWVKLDDGRQFFYQTLNSCAYQHEKYEKLYIGPGATIELPALWRELEENGVPHHKLGISPLTSILQDIDAGYEKGTHDFSGNDLRSALHAAPQLVVGESLRIEGHDVNARLNHGPVVPGTVKLTLVSVGHTWTVEFKENGKLDRVDGQAMALGLDLEESRLDGQTVRLKFAANVIGVTATYEYMLSGVTAGGPLAATGSTAHGCGANRARRVLRRKEARYAKDIPELRPFLCDVPTEIMQRLDRGEAGLLEIAQGFQLSYMLQNMFPFTTSRNCTVAAGLDDMMLPPYYAGNVILNFRTYPIRINSNKYVDKDTGKHLTWQEIEERKLRVCNFEELAKQDDVGTYALADVKLVKGNSGPGYHDQEELTWEELTKRSGSTTPIMEMTSVTKLPRRVFTFSRQNMHEAIKHNATGGQMWLSVNFMNYVDAGIAGRRGVVPSISDQSITESARRWMYDNLQPYLGMLRFIGTGPLTDDKIDLDNGKHAHQVWPNLGAKIDPANLPLPGVGPNPFDTPAEKATDLPPVGVAHKPG